MIYVMETVGKVWYLFIWMCIDMRDKVYTYLHIHSCYLQQLENFCLTVHVPVNRIILAEPCI